jgi:hypothetical protein
MQQKGSNWQVVNNYGRWAERQLNGGTVVDDRYPASDPAIAERHMQLAVGGADNKTVSWRGRLASVLDAAEGLVQ